MTGMAQALDTRNFGRMPCLTSEIRQQPAVNAILTCCEILVRVETLTGRISSMSKSPSNRNSENFVEFALIIILLAIVMLSILLIVGDNIRELFNDIGIRWSLFGHDRSAVALRTALAGLRWQRHFPSYPASRQGNSSGNGPLPAWTCSSHPRALAAAPWGAASVPAAPNKWRRPPAFVCQRCGHRRAADARLCAKCTDSTPGDLCQVRAASLHVEPLRTFIHQLKYEDHPDLAAPLGPLPGCSLCRARLGRSARADGRRCTDTDAP